MNHVTKTILKSLRDRIELAKKKIRMAEEDITYQTQVINESRELIEKIQEANPDDTNL